MLLAGAIILLSGGTLGLAFEVGMGVATVFGAARGAAAFMRDPQGTVTRRVNYVFSGLEAGDYRVGVMADPARPDLVTTDLGLDRLWNRTITLLAIAGLTAATIVGALLSMVRARRGAAAA